jgi:hypothetical protein
MTTLSCFMYMMNYSSHYLGSFYWLSYHNVSFIIGSCIGFIDDGEHYAANSSNFDKQKFVKVLNKLIVVCIVANTSQTPRS